MSILLELAVPLILAAVGIHALMSGADVFPALCRGAAQGLTTLKDMLPTLIVLFPAVYMLRASGALDALSALLEPVMAYIGVPPETVPLALLRPVSGGAATAVASDRRKQRFATADIIKSCGADSLAGRTAAVMIGSSETTFYVIAVYFGAARIKNTRHAIPAALLADLAVFMLSAWSCRMLWG